MKRTIKSQIGWGIDGNHNRVCVEGEMGLRTETKRSQNWVLDNLNPANARCLCSLRSLTSTSIFSNLSGQSKQYSEKSTCSPFVSNTNWTELSSGRGTKSWVGSLSLGRESRLLGFDRHISINLSMRDFRRPNLSNSDADVKSWLSSDAFCGSGSIGRWE